MATKNCPTCEKQVPVACKKCTCGHSFFTNRRRRGTEARSDRSEGDDSETHGPISPSNSGGIIEAPRRTTRVQRDRPQFYDALQLENQTRQKMLLRKQMKEEKKEYRKEEPEIVNSLAKDNGSEAAKASVETAPPSEETCNEDINKKKRRGRPPGLNHNAAKRGKASLAIGPNKSGDRKLNTGNPDELSEMDGHDLLSDLSPEKAVQMNVILQEINRKIISTNFRVE